jgi:hypothetical protein
MLRRRAWISECYLKLKNKNSMEGNMAQVNRGQACFKEEKSEQNVDTRE